MLKSIKKTSNYYILWFPRLVTNHFWKILNFTSSKQRRTLNISSYL